MQVLSELSQTQADVLSSVRWAYIKMTSVCLKLQSFPQWSSSELIQNCSILNLNGLKTKCHYVLVNNVQ